MYLEVLDLHHIYHVLQDCGFLPELQFIFPTVSGSQRLHINEDESSNTIDQWLWHCIWGRKSLSEMKLYYKHSRRHS